MNFMFNSLLRLWKFIYYEYLKPSQTFTAIRVLAAAAAAKLLQSCLTLCDPIDSSPPGPTIPGILQARTLEWVAISSSKPNYIPFIPTIVLGLQRTYGIEQMSEKMCCY